MVLSDRLAIPIQVMTAGFRLSTRKSRHQRTQQNGQTNQEPANRRTASTGNRNQVVEAKPHASFFKTLEKLPLLPILRPFLGRKFPRIGTTRQNFTTFPGDCASEKSEKRRS